MDAFQFFHLEIFFISVKYNDMETVITFFEKGNFFHKWNWQISGTDISLEITVGNTDSPKVNS